MQADALRYKKLVFCTKASTGIVILHAPAPVLEVLVMPAVVPELR